MSVPPLRARRALATAAILLATACASDGDAPTAVGAPPTTVRQQASPEAPTVGQLQGAARVRSATSAFHDLAAAQTAGYTSQYPAGCAQSASGAQGFHYLNPDLVDATVELLRPELLMYEPRPDGTLQLIGVDYVVPFELWPAADPPSLLGTPFMRNEPLGVWALHIWAWRPNPSGLFAMWNPAVSCARAR